MIVRFKKNPMYIIGGCLQQLIYIAWQEEDLHGWQP